MASLNPALWHGLDHLGAIAPGYQADLLLLPRPRVVRPGARAQARRGRSSEIPHVQVPEWVKQTMRLDARRTGRLPRCPWRRRERTRDRLDPRPDRDRSRSRTSSVVEDGYAVADPARDLAKIAVLERHLGTGRIGLGFVRGFGLQRGAFGATLSHDAHNVVVVGVDDGDMARRGRATARARRRHRRRRRRTRFARSCPCPVAGLLSDRPLAEVLDASRGINEAAQALG